MYSKKNRLRKMIPFSLCQTLFSSLISASNRRDTLCSARACGAEFDCGDYGEKLLASVNLEVLGSEQKEELYYDDLNRCLSRVRPCEKVFPARRRKSSIAAKARINQYIG